MRLAHDGWLFAHRCLSLANAFTHHTDLAMAAGMDDVLFKPYHTEQLLAAMANFVPDLISI